MPRWRHFDEALRLDPTCVQALVNRGRTRVSLGEPAGAIADFDEALRLRPELADVYAARGNVRATVGDEEGALADFAAALRLKPDHHAHSGRGKLRLKRGDFEGARADFDASIDVMAECSPCHSNRGEARAVLGDLDGASSDFARSSDIGGADSSADLWSVALGGDRTRLLRYLDHTDWAGGVARHWSGKATREEALETALRGVVTEANRAKWLCYMHALLGSHAERAGDLELAHESYEICMETGLEPAFDFRFAKARLAALR